jgi:hypothetical protein
MYRNGLVTCTEITAVIGSLPGTCYYMITCAASRGINIAVSDNRRRITVIRCSGASRVCWKDWILAVHSNVGRAGNYWRCNIMYRNGLNAGTEISAVIGSLPGTCYYMIACTASRSIYIAVTDNRRRITVIRCSGDSRVCWKDWILAVHSDVGRAGNYWRCNIMYRNGLNAGTEITAVIGSLPGTCYYMIACTASRGINI